MQFQALSPESLLFCASDGNGNTNLALLYLLPAGTASPPSTISFEESWSGQGTYLFLEQPLDTGQASAFADAAWNFLEAPHMVYTRFVWFNQPQPGAGLAGTNLAVYQPATGSYATAFQADFVFQNTSLIVAANTAIAPDLTNFAFVLTQTGGNSIYLSADWGMAPVNSLGATLTIPFTGSLAGCLQFSANLSLQNLADLDAGLRYYYAEVAGLEDPSQITQSFFLDSLRFPIFSAAVQLYANLDPLAPLAPARSFFAFNAADAGQSGPSAAPQVATNYSSTLGFAYSLLPQPGSALVFAVNRQASTPNSQDPYYLVPSGNFQLATAQQGHVNIMCGLSGVEYISPVSQPSATANMLTFYPGQAAFAPGFYPGEAPGYTQVVPQQMPTTSFVWIAQVTPQQNNPLSYFAQPDQSVLYNIDTADPNNINGLAPVAVLANTLPSAPPQGALFPMMPYGGLSGQDLGPFAQMETQAIGPARRLALAQTGNPTTPANPEQLTSTYSATPQGLLVQYSEGATTWPYVVLGQTQVQPPGQQLTTQLFQLSGVQGQLLTALETNKLFLVVSNPQVFSAFLESVNALISVGAPADAWTFNIDPALWTRSDASQSTIFILKFSDLSISDLAGEPSAWAFANTFNSSPSQVSAIIGQIIQNAAGEGSDFEQFLYAVNTPTWNGILVLNASAPLSALPPQLAGIGAGIDPSLFYAHHVGINASKIVVNTGQQLGIDNSSIFGLINYNGGPLQPSSNDYQFTVRTLRVLFLNSAVAGFSSTIDFQINSLFAEPANLSDPSANNVVEMFGVYQHNIVNGVGQDSYAFQTASGLSATFDMTSQVLNAVEIVQGQFITLTAQSTQTDVQSQFVFWGLMDFQSLKGFDAFSFGRESGSSTPAGLNFAKLAVQMSYNPQNQSPPAFVFDASQISFDMAASTARAASFYSHFPISLASFTQAPAGVTPAGQGFMSVQTPLNQSLLSFPWFSLNFNLNLGTTGALAAQAGFVATVTIGWGPNQRDYMVFTGLKLPGSNGPKRAITIEGIFDIGFKTLEIVSIPSTSTYILVLYGINFEFLSFQFPPNGQVNFVLFGNPGQSKGTNLGWYAAYAKTGSGGGGGDGGGDKNLLAAAQLRRLTSAIPGGVR